MSNFWIILFHTYVTKLKSKSFIWSTIITLLLVVGLSNMSNIINMFDKNGGKTKIAVIDTTGQLFIGYKEQMKTLDKDLQLSNYKKPKSDAEKAVEDGDYDGVLVLKFDKENLPEGTYSAMNLSDAQLISELQNGLQQMKTMMSAAKIKLTSEQLAKLYAPVELKQVSLEQNAKTAEELNQARGLVYVMLFVIYFAVIMYANMIAMEVATEKSSRIMEILISSVSPIKQMFAKILGIGLLSLTQMAVLIGAGYFSVQRNLESMQGGFFEVFGFENIPAQTIVYGVIFFILGYFLYATLAAFLGSLVSRIEDIQQTITPMTMLVVAGFMLAMFGLGNPSASYVTVTSFIPFFSPMLMFMRVGMLEIPTWEVLVSIGILIATIAILAVFGARVYKGGVLLYGKSNSFKDIKKALQLSKDE